MSVSQLLLPLRVPELGPHLGKLVIGTGRRPGGFDLEHARYRLVTRILEGAGEARRLAARGDRHAAVAALGRPAWLESWEEAVATIAEALVEQVDRHLAGEARARGMSRRLQRRIGVDTAEKRAITARLGSAGAGLVPVLDELERSGEAAVQATAAHRGAIEGWQTNLTMAARRLEAAWLALEDGIETEVAHWMQIADDVACWRKPLWPVVVIAIAGLSLATWIGLVMGGFVRPPGWFTAVWQSFQ
jgi:hypothetical protein